MIEGQTSRDFATAKTWAYRAPEEFAQLIDILIASTSDYLIAQVEAGAEVLQLFDSWAGVWPEAALRRWCLEPAVEIVRRVKAAQPGVPVILFPRGAGLLYEAFAIEAGAEGLSLDTTVPLTWARERLQGRVALQGNLDPLVLVAGGAVLERGVSKILETLGSGSLIFNLGHGITPQVPLEHVEQLVAQVRDWRPGT
jgi:uroporphyrinogen decarboxylase